MKSQPILILILGLMLFLTVVSAENVCDGDSCYNKGQLNINFQKQAICGNGVIENAEQCDGSNLGGLSCRNFGYDRGTIGCNSACQIDISRCFSNGDDTENERTGRIAGSDIIISSTDSSTNTEDTGDTGTSGQDSDYNAPITGSAIRDVMGRLFSWQAGAFLILLGLIVFFAIRMK